MKTADKIDEVVDTCRRFGGDSIIILSGTAGTGKTHISRQAAEKVAGHPFLVKEIQFHQGYSYEDFIEGLMPTAAGHFLPRAGSFMTWNTQALQDPDNQYVLLIEEFTRANISAVLGELMTYLEHRGRSFETPITRSKANVAKNLTVLGTMNPRDRSALEVDDALIRRLRIVDCPPSVLQLREMLKDDVEDGLVDSLAYLFDEIRKARGDDEFNTLMPFGHGIFAGVKNASDLTRLWRQRIKHLLFRPLTPAHPFASEIERLYPWRHTGTASTGQPAAIREAPEIASADSATAALPSVGGQS